MGGGEVVVLPPRQPYAPREVDVFAVHEVALVQAANFLIDFAGEHQEGTWHDLYLVHLVLGQVPHIVGGKAFVVWKQVDEARYLVERCFGRRKAALALLEVAAVAVDHLHAQASAVVVFSHEVDALHEGVVLNDSVGVEQEEALARAAGERLVIGAGKANVLLVGDDVHFGEVLAHHLHRPVHRVVVHYPHVKFQIATVGQPAFRAVDRCQALLEEVLDVIVDYDDRKRHLFLASLAFSGVINDFHSLVEAEG